MNLRYTDRAKVDLEVAFLWYEKQRGGLGFEFLDCIKEAVRQIIAAPELYRFH